MIPPYALSEPSVFAFVLIPALLVALFVSGVELAWLRSGASTGTARRVAVFALACAAVWMGLAHELAARGVLLEWDRRPPPFALMFGAIVLVACGVAFSRIGTRLAETIPLWVLVLVQGFRLPLELAMHRMAERGIMPEQMSYTGRNWDIVTGITAFLVAALVYSGRAGRALVVAWNLLGFALLLNVVVVAMVSTPVFRWFGPDRLNIWVMLPPFVWLPTVMVLAALIGHLIVFRATRAGTSASQVRSGLTRAGFD